MSRSYVKAHHDWIEQLSGLTDDQFGQLMRSLINYSAMGEEEHGDGIVHTLFPVFKSQVDRDKKAYKSKVENSKRGGAPLGNKNAKKNEK